MKIKIDNGDMTINIYDMLEELFRNAEPEEVEQLYHTLGWFHPAYRELIYTTRETFVGENYNSKFFKLFKDFFTLPGRWEYHETKEKDVFYRMSQAMEAILKENAELRIENRRMSILDYRMKEWFIARFAYVVHPDDLDGFANEVYSKIKELLRVGEADKTTHEASKEMVERVDYKSWVLTWVNEVYKMFGEEE